MVIKLEKLKYQVEELQRQQQTLEGDRSTTFPHRTQEDLLVREIKIPVSNYRE
jgi:hypothetical protein